MVLVFLLVVVVVVLLLLMVLSFGSRFGFGVGFWIGVRFEVEENPVPEVRGHRCRVGGFLVCCGGAWVVCVGVGGPLAAWCAAAALALAVALWMRLAGRRGSEDEVEDVDEDEDEEGVVVFGDEVCAVMRAVAGLLVVASSAAPTAGRMEGMSSGRRLRSGGWGGPPVKWGPGGPIWSATVGEGGVALRSSPAGLGWAGVLQWVRLCG